MTALGFEYLTLRTFAANPGSLEPAGTDVSTADQPTQHERPSRALTGDLASSAR